MKNFFKNVPYHTSTKRSYKIITNFPQAKRILLGFYFSGKLYYPFPSKLDSFFIFFFLLCGFDGQLHKFSSSMQKGVSFSLVPGNQGIMYENQRTFCKYRLAFYGFSLDRKAFSDSINFEIRENSLIFVHCSMEFSFREN